METQENGTAGAVKKVNGLAFFSGKKLTHTVDSNYGVRYDVPTIAKAIASMYDVEHNVIVHRTMRIALEQDPSYDGASITCDMPAASVKIIADMVALYDKLEQKLNSRDWITGDSDQDDKMLRLINARMAECEKLTNRQYLPASRGLALAVTKAVAKVNVRFRKFSLKVGVESHLMTESRETDTAAPMLSCDTDYPYVLIKLDDSARKPVAILPVSQDIENRGEKLLAELDAMAQARKQALADDASDDASVTDEHLTDDHSAQGEHDTLAEVMARKPYE